MLVEYRIKTNAIIERMVFNKEKSIDFLGSQSIAAMDSLAFTIILADIEISLKG
jgi:hypothetical protein